MKMEEYIVITRRRAIHLLTRQVLILGWHHFNNKELLEFLEAYYPKKNYVMKSRFFFWLFLNKRSKPNIPLCTKANQEQYTRYRTKADDLLLTGITGHHPEVIISDAIPTKWQIFWHKLNPFASKERKRMYKFYERKDNKINN